VGKKARAVTKVVVVDSKPTFTPVVAVQPTRTPPANQTDRSLELYTEKSNGEYHPRNDQGTA
jgi:hypothetical protein